MAHAGAALSVWLATTVAAVFGALLPMCRTEPRIPESIEVSVVTLPKSKLNVPDRAQRVKRASGEVAAPEPPPVRESDLAVQTDKPPPKPGNTEAALRQQLIEQMERDQLLQQLMEVPEGAVDRDATDPNGQENAAALAATGVAARGDPEYARWEASIRQILAPRFKPLAAVTQANPGLECRVSIQLDPATGEIVVYEVVGPSGVLSFDQAAERAVQEVTTLPLPPERYLPLMEQGFTFTFVDQG